MRKVQPILLGDRRHDQLHFHERPSLIPCIIAPYPPEDLRYISGVRARLSREPRGQSKESILASGNRHNSKWLRNSRILAAESGEAVGKHQDTRSHLALMRETRGVLGDIFFEVAPVGV